jgi:transglutaminase-like putative cysteine protease
VIYDVVHRTSYTYDAPVTASYGSLRVLPADMDGQRCLERTVATSPESEHQREHTDYFGNTAATFAIHGAHTQLVVTARSAIDTSARPSHFDDAGDRPWESFAAPANAGFAGDLTALEYSIDSPLVGRSQALAAYGARSFAPERALADAVLDLNRRIHTDFAFDPKATDVTTTLDEVLELRKGVCQDFAHVMVGALRSTGLAACYVSGYLETDPPPGQARLAGADRTHAWVGVYTGQGRFIGVDPTNDRMAGPRYITTARGRDYADVPPMKGVIFTDAEESTLTVEVDVAPR